jgi:hypothetical protein
MKKLFIPLVLLLFVILGCNRTKENPNEVKVESYTISDSVFLENEFGQDYSRYYMYLELPVTDNDTLRENIIEWMLEPGTKDYVAFFKADKDRFFAEEGDEPESEFNGSFALLEQTDTYVTYIADGYVYTGGAHPMPWYYGVTFSKLDGSVMGYDLFVDDIFDAPEQLIELISINIRDQYFDKINNEEEEYLFEPDDYFPLPTNQPWVESDSVVFCYGPFEIAPYAAGMPLCKIPIKDLQPYLSEKGKSLFNN